MSEIPLLGGRITPGVVRVGNTVRRPTNPNSEFVHELLLHLDRVGFDAAPRFLGIDKEGREVLSYREGSVPADLCRDYPDEVLAGAAALLRAYHDAAATSALAAGEETVCHNDISPVNAVFVDGLPVALIDFDAAVPGPPMRDLAYALFLWLHLTEDGLPLTEQARRTQVFFAAYGMHPPQRLTDEILERQRERASMAAARPGATRWWFAQADWLEQNRAEYEEAFL